jgi:hypothetical protein
MLSPIVAPTIILLAALSIASNTAAVADQNKADQSVQPLEGNPDAYAIYSVLLPAEDPSVNSWNIWNETERGPLPMCLTPPLDQESTYRPVIEHFETLNQRRYLLRRSFDLIAYNLVSREDKVLPIFEVSAVGFNMERTRALVYVGHHCGNLCGGGTYHLMVKKNGKWEPDREFRGGPMCLWVS